MPSVEIKPGFGSVATATNENTTLIPLFGANVGAVGDVFLTFAADMGTVALRVAVRVAGKSTWTMHNVVVDSGQDWVGVTVPAKATHASVMRTDRGTPSEATVPVIAEIIVKGA